MQIRHVILKVADQDKALAFYTNILGFVKKRDDRRGRMRWLTISSSKASMAAVDLTVSLLRLFIERKLLCLTQGL